MIKTKPVKIQDYQKVIDMLQSISDFIPRDEDINDVWEAFISQDNLNGFSFFLDKNGCRNDFILSFLIHYLELE